MVYQSKCYSLNRLRIKGKMQKAMDALFSQVCKIVQALLAKSKTRESCLSPPKKKTPPKYFKWISLCSSMYTYITFTIFLLIYPQKVYKNRLILYS